MTLFKKTSLKRASTIQLTEFSSKGRVCRKDVSVAPLTRSLLLFSCLYSLSLWMVAAHTRPIYSQHKHSQLQPYAHFAMACPSCQGARLCLLCKTGWIPGALVQCLCVRHWLHVLRVSWCAGGGAAAPHCTLTFQVKLT